MLEKVTVFVLLYVPLVAPVVCHTLAALKPLSESLPAPPVTLLMLRNVPVKAASVISKPSSVPTLASVIFAAVK